MSVTISWQRNDYTTVFISSFKGAMQMLIIIDINLIDNS